MMPVYRYTDSSYPTLGNQVPFVQHRHPGSEAVPPQVNSIPSNAAFREPWPYHVNNVGYSASPCHPCFNHGNFPGYCGFRPPYLHHSPHQLHCCGYHPAVPEVYPVQYVPSPYYMMQQRAYDYGKGDHREFHCCKCPDHTHNQRNERGVKVEEQEPDPDVHKNDMNSLVPQRSGNYPYPIVWIPNDHVKNTEKRKPLESSVANKEKAADDLEPARSAKQSEGEPRGSNGWFPFDVKNLESLLRGEDVSKTQGEKNGNNSTQFPFPIIRLPSYNKQAEADKEVNGQRKSPKTSDEEPPSAFKFFPVNLLDHGKGSTEQPKLQETDDSKAGSESKERNANLRSIQVKQLDASKDENSDKTEIKPTDKNVVGKASGATSRRQSSSPPKSPKLPPVCLRVDPLPKKRTVNGASKSPSPPKSKSASQLSDLRVDANQDSQARKSNLSGTKQVEAKSNGEKVIQMVEKQNRDNKNEESNTTSKIQITVLPVDAQEVSEDSITDSKREGGDKSIIEAASSHPVDVGEPKEATPEAMLTGGEKESGRWKLSDEEAALLIQSVYRGYNVRRWEPLRKLKQIAQVQEQLSEIRSRILALESSPDLQKDDKQRVIIEEMIMSLLLKLDTVQGLHPSIREMRKSLARELVTLQEKLDSIKVDMEMARDMPSTALGAGDFAGAQVQQNEETGAQRNEDKETSEPLSIGVEDFIKHVDDMREAIMKADVGSLVGKADTEGGVGEFNRNGQSELVVKENQEGEFVSTERQQRLQVPAERCNCSDINVTLLEDRCSDQSSDVQLKTVGGTESTPTNNYATANKQEELKQGVIDLEVTCSDKSLPSEMEMTLGMHSAVTDPTVTKWTDLKVDEDPAALVVEEGHSKEATALFTQVKEMEEKLPVETTSPANVVQNVAADKEIREENLLLDDAEKVQGCEKSERQEWEFLHGNDMELNGAVDAALSGKEGPIFDEMEKQPADLLDESILVDGSDSCAESASQNVYESLEVANCEEVPICEVKEQPMEMPNESFSTDKRKDNVEGGSEDAFESPVVAVPKEIEQQPELFNVVNEDKHVEVFEPEKMSPTSPEMEQDDHEEACDDKGTSGRDIDFSPTHGPQNLATSTQEAERLAAENRDITAQQVAGVEKADVIHKEEEDEMEMVSVNDNREISPGGVEAIEKDIMLPLNVMIVEDGIEERDLSPVSPTSSQLSVSEKMLVEENEKLWEMMEKLIEAGKEQLTAISNLTGRVKGLERKLSRKKKLRTRRCRTTVSPSSYARPLNDSLEKRAANVVR